MPQNKSQIRAICVCSILGAIGFILMCLEFPLPFIIPPFIKFDFSELPAIIAAFSLGPVWGVIVCLIKNLLHLLFFFSNSAGVGELSNFLLGAVFTFVSGLVYKKMHTRKGALIGVLIGALLMAAVSIVTNYFVVYPAYVKIYGMPLNVIIGMYKAILPAADSLLKCLIIFNFPFTFIKGVIDAVICFAVYKKISPIIKG